MPGIEDILLQMLMGQTQPKTPVYQSMPGYLPNQLTYSPNSGMIGTLVNALKGIMFPGAITYAPTYMPQFSFMEMQRQGAMRQSTIQQYKAFNPVALAGINNLMSETLGIDMTGVLTNQQGGVTQIGRIISDLTNRILGANAGAFSQMGQMQNTVRSTMQGLIVGPGSLNMFSTGVSNIGAQQILGGLMRGTYEDPALLRRRGLYGHQDMMEVMRIAKDYNVFVGSQTPEEITRKTMGFSRVMLEAQQTFMTPNKEEALRNLLEVTGGAIPLTDTGQLQDTLRKVRDMGRSANISMDIMKEILMRGQEISRQLGMTGVVGTEITLGAMNQLRNIQALPGEGPTARTIARVGGQQQANFVYADFMQQTLASTGYRRASGLVGTFQEMGMTANMQDVMNVMAQGGRLTPEQESEYVNQIAQEIIGRGDANNPRQARLEAQRRVQANIMTGQEIFARDPAAIMKGQTVQIMEDIRQRSYNDPVLQGIIDKYFTDPASLTAEDKRRLRASFVTLGRDVMVGQMNIAPEDAALMAETMLARMGNEEELAQMEKAQRKTSARFEINRKYEEMTRQKDNALTRALAKTAYGGDIGDIFAAALPQTHDAFALQNMTEEELNRVLTGGEDIIRRFGQTLRGMDIYKAATGIYGRGIGANIETADLLVTNKIKKSDIVVKMDPKVSGNEKIKGMLRDGIPITLADVLDAQGIDASTLTKEQLEDALGVMKGLDQESYSSTMKLMENAQLQGYKIQDLIPELSYITTSDISKEELNKIYGVKMIAGRLGVDEFESFAALRQAVEDSGDPNIKRAFKAMTTDSTKFVEEQYKSLQDVRNVYKKELKKQKEYKKRVMWSQAAYSPEMIMGGVSTVPEEIYDELDISGFDIGMLEAEAGLYGAPMAILKRAEKLGINIKDTGELTNYIAALQKKGLDPNRYKLTSKHLAAFKALDTAAIEGGAEGAVSYFNTMSFVDKMKLVHGGQAGLADFFKDTQLTQDQRKHVAYLSQEDLKKKIDQENVEFIKMDETLKELQSIKKLIKDFIASLDTKVIKTALE